MTVFRDLQGVSLFALLTVFVGLVPLMIGALYAIRPAERWLALMRPVSLAAVFAALASLMSGLMVVLRGVSATPLVGIEMVKPLALGVAESVTPMFVTFGCLTAAWLLVALRIWREGRLEEG